MHEECRDGEVRVGILLDRAVVYMLESERHGFAVFSGQHHLPHLGKDVGDLGSLQGLVPRHQQAFVVKEDLFRVGIAHQLDGHRSIAGGEAFADLLAGRDAAKAVLRDDLAADPLRQRHGCDGIRSRGCRRLGQEPICLYAIKIFSRTVVAVPRWLLGITFCHSQRWRYRERSYQSGSGRTCLQKISALHNFLSWSVVLRISGDPVDQATQLTQSSGLRCPSFKWTSTGFPSGKCSSQTDWPDGGFAAKVPGEAETCSIPCRAIKATSCFLADVMVRSTLRVFMSQESLSSRAKVRSNIPFMDPLSSDGGSAGSTSTTPGRE